MSVILRTVGWLHRRLVKGRQSERIAAMLTPLLPTRGRVLDVGCGTGKISRLIREKKDALSIQGVDILCQPNAEIPVEAFDGQHIPFGDREFDAVTLVDVLHHTTHQQQLLQEALRVCRGSVVIKDHICEGPLSFAALAFMDWVGNKPLGITSPCTYLSSERWQRLFDEMDSVTAQAIPVTGLYPFPFNLLFEYRKQVIYRLTRNESQLSRENRRRSAQPSGCAAPQGTD